MRKLLNTVIVSLISLLVITILCHADPAQTVMVSMRDGVKLATDIYLPEGDGPWPAILMRTPY